MRNLKKEKKKLESDPLYLYTDVSNKADSNLFLTKMVLSRVHASTKTQQSPLIQSSLIQYQINVPLQSCGNDFFSSLHCLVPVLVGEALSGFSVPEVVRIARLKDGLSVLELFHGQTLAFKDLAMTCTVRFLNYFLQKENHRATVVVGEKYNLLCPLI